MRKNRNLFYLGIAFWAATILLSIMFTARVVGSHDQLLQGLDQNARATQAQMQDLALVKATNAAFRDGLFQGQLAAANNSEQHIASGRWSTTADREYFRKGYQLGFNGSFAIDSTASELH